MSSPTMAGPSRDDLVAQHKKSPKKVHMSLQEKYDVCCLADESPLSLFGFSGGCPYFVYHIRYDYYYYYYYCYYYQLWPSQQHHREFFV